MSFECPIWRKEGALTKWQPEKNGHKHNIIWECFPPGLTTGFPFPSLRFILGVVLEAPHALISAITFAHVTSPWFTSSSLEPPSLLPLISSFVLSNKTNIKSDHE